MQNYTTIEQSKKLVELGLSPKTADMWFQDGQVEPVIGNYALHIQCMEDPDYKKTHKTLISPAWSLGALLNLLPPFIKVSYGIRNQYEINIRKYFGGNSLYIYQIVYENGEGIYVYHIKNNRGFDKEWHDAISTEKRENLIDAAFEMLCWLLENDFMI